MILTLLLALTAWSADHPYATCVDRLEREGLNKNALEQAFTRFSENSHLLPVSDHILLADYSQHSREKRFYLINPEQCRYFSTHLAHSKTSDKDLDGLVDNCEGSTPQGLFLASGLYSREKEFEAQWESASWWQMPKVYLDANLKSHSTIATLEEDGKTWPAQGIILVALEGQKEKRALLREGVEASLKNVRRFQGALRNNGDLAISPGKLRDLEKSLKISRGTLLFSYIPQCQ